MADLQARVKHLASAPIVAALKSIIFPVLTIPPEITAEIFVRYVDKPHGEALAEHGGGPLLLASVCKEWRHIALGLQSIWANIREHLLDLNITTYDHGRALAALTPYSMQWRALSCNIGMRNSYAISDIRGHIPFLRALAITLYDMNASQPPISAFSDAPNLRELTLVTTYANSLPALITLPWEQLTRLDYNHRDIPQCMKLLSLTPHLEIFSVSAALSARESEPPASVRLDRLHTLHFKRYSTLGLLDYVVLPSLKHLHIDSVTQYSKLTPFLARPGCSIVSISFGSTASSWLYVEAGLVAAPTFTEVFIGSFVSHRDLFSKLRTEPDFLPNLQTLSLTTKPAQLSLDDILQEMTEMLVARWYGSNGSVQLTSFHLVCYPDSPNFFSHLYYPNTSKAEYHIDKLQMLAAGGCKMNIHGLAIATKDTGTVTVIVAGLDLAMFVKLTDTNYYFALYYAYILGKLYSNSFMLSLNMREPNKCAPPSESSEMRIHVTCNIERNGVRRRLFQEDIPATWKTATDMNESDDIFTPEVHTLQPETTTHRLRRVESW
ncbi:hypothetical protein B0H19DRAFT_1373548 [Mycena capillaripes]|nr:hypothetical protein B0H19DRAFT_1373548 [Mycena capillaripes]